jgi:hypothetical protein
MPGLTVGRAHLGLPAVVKTEQLKRPRFLGSFANAVPVLVAKVLKCGVAELPNIGTWRLADYPVYKHNAAVLALLCVDRHDLAVVNARPYHPGAATRTNIFAVERFNFSFHRRRVAELRDLLFAFTTQYNPHLLEPFQALLTLKVLPFSKVTAFTSAHWTFNDGGLLFCTTHFLLSSQNLA